jgi:hypothetical protein
MATGRLRSVVCGWAVAQCKYPRNAGLLRSQLVRDVAIATLLIDTWWSIRRRGAVDSILTWQSSAGTIAKYQPSSLDREMIAGLRRLKALYRHVSTRITQLKIDNSCLHRSAFLFRVAVCEPWAHDVHVVIGVAPPNRGELRSHAWVVVNGAPLFEGGRERGFTPIASLPS